MAIIFLCSCQSNQEDEEVVTEQEVLSEMDDLSTSPFGSQKFMWVFQDDFTAKQKEKLKNWIIEVGEATIQTIGQYPFDVEIVFHKSSRGGNKAVTFGHTDRGKVQGVHFYVNPDRPYNEFIEDWTAPHEISHLSAPFVGKKFKWFAEGYATYLSRKIMITMNQFTQEEFDEMYTKRIVASLKFYDSSTKTHAEISDSLLSQHIYGDMYWGSASYFYTADKELEKKFSISLSSVITKYQDCCRLKDKNVHMMVKSLDEIVGDKLFYNLFDKYVNQPSSVAMQPYM
ncbi:hypothetical protein K6119_14590 [Paracrocinitomix mangrovi]|uniref:hypothetical protein n=1 Tax=Paracrocinitomix mangrovi TaxID=2862509 RepID=UPI001C8E2216|nr:hypothetical protein [Paracrocinitomix mangrovi]UKN00960.1 hypothetical protein K6119_14590 [Paracrocinitomix mangrovi]